MQQVCSAALTDGDILDELGVELGLRQHALDGVAEQLLGARLGEAALLGLGDGRAQRRDDDDCVRKGERGCGAWLVRRARTVVVVLGEHGVLSLGQSRHGGRWDGVW
jgi:hypothetical protein